MIEFIEPRTELAGISRRYREHILPQLERMEGRRSKAVGSVVVTLPLLAAGGAIATYAAHGMFRSPDILFWGGGITLAVCGAVATKLLGKVKAQTKDVLVGEVARYVGWQFSAKAVQPAYLQQYLTHKLLPRHDRSSFEDRISGTAHGADFTMVEAKLEIKHKNNYTTAFRGFVLSIDFHQPFASTTVVLRDKGLFNAKRMKGSSGGTLKRVGMASPKWEKLFEAYSDDQVEARVKLDPAFMERLMELEESVDGKKLRFAFFDNRLHVVCETPNRYEAGSMFKPLTDPQRMQDLIDEVDALYGVIDGVQKRAPRPVASG